MSDSTGCKVVVLLVMVAIIVGALGFATGYVTHGVLVAGTAEELLLTEVESPSGGQSSPDSASPGPSPTEPAPASLPEPTSPPTVVSSPTEEEDAAFQLFWEAWHLIERDFYGDLPADEEVTYGAIRGAINALDDPYTGFIDPDAAEYRREVDDGAYEGIGAFVNMENDRLVIVQPMKGQPAEKAGLLPGDIVLEADGVPIENMSIYEAISLLLGPAGTQVRLTILREGEEPFEVEITRAEIEVPQVESEMRDDGLAYVSLANFNHGASEGLADTLDDLLDQNPEGLVLDLRGNPGGFLHEAVLTAGLFLPEEEVVMVERTKDEEEFLTPKGFGSDKPIAPDIPMVVLVDGGSASASEIVAGALQDHERAVLIGEKTFGKGSVQWAHELSNGAELRVTIARWFTPNDRAIHGEGLEPDIEVELTPEDVEAELDPQLDRAAEYLLVGE